MPPKIPSKTTQEILEESTRVATEAARERGLTFIPGGQPVIDSEMLKPQSVEQFRLPEYKPPSDVSNLNTISTPVEFTQPERDVNDLSTQLQDLQTRLLGQSSLRAEKEAELNIGELKKTQSDLTARLNALINESKSIPLQVERESEGRLRTQGAIENISRGRQRDIAIQSLAVSSQLEAARGNLSTALDLVDRAVAERFDPIKEEIAVKQANLELILRSPAYSQAEKRRATIELARQKEAERDIKVQEEAQKRIWTIATEAAKNGVDSVILRNIQNAKTPEEALNLAGSSLQNLTSSVETIAGRKVQIVRDQQQNIVRTKDLGASTSGSDDSSDESSIDDWARRINSGSDKISSVPINIRSQVISRTRDFAEEDLIEDVRAGTEKGLKKDDLIKELEKGYPEFSKKEITNAVEKTLPTTTSTTKRETPGTGVVSKIKSFFGSLIR